MCLCEKENQVCKRKSVIETGRKLLQTIIAGGDEKLDMESCNLRGKLRLAKEVDLCFVIRLKMRANETGVETDAFNLEMEPLFES